MSDDPNKNDSQTSSNRLAKETKTRKFFSEQYGQIIYGIILIVLIPVAIIFNTLNLVNNFNANLDIQLQRQAYMVGEIFNATVAGYLDDVKALQKTIETAAASSDELYGLDVLYPEGDNFKVVASLDPTSIGQTSADLGNVIAWREGQTLGKLTNSQAISIVGAEDLGDQRYWSVVRPLYNSNEEKVALLHSKMSLAVMDRQSAQTLFRATILLVITIIIVILLLILNTRMFEYANLFRKLKEVDVMKDEFISIASHELRTPITALKGYVDMFTTGDFGQVNQHGQQGLKIMTGSIDRLGALVEDLLNVSRIEQNRLELKMESVQPNQLLALVVEELRIQAEAKKLILQLKIETELPKILADTDKFKQIFINIIGNSIKYTKKGSVNVTTFNKDDRFVIKVKDTGIGMSAQQRERLFEKFYRIKSDETKGIVGTGLGLWITKQLVEMMKGEIAVDSIEGVGSEFVVSFPIASA